MTLIHTKISAQSLGIQHPAWIYRQCWISAPTAPLSNLQSLKLAKDRPSWTIQAQPGSAIGPFHWENRKLSWRELAAIQTFPRDFKIDSPRVEIQRQIGNAVPSLLAEVLGRALREQVCGHRISEPLRLAITGGSAPPPPAPVQPVPKQYMSLVGNHAPHPGTGKGRSYQATAQPALTADVAKPRR